MNIFLWSQNHRNHIRHLCNGKILYQCLSVKIIILRIFYIPLPKHSPKLFTHLQYISHIVSFLYVTFILRLIFFIWLLVNSYHANRISCASHMLLKCVSVLYILKYFKPFLPEYCFFIFVVIFEFLMKFFPITFFAGQVS